METLGGTNINGGMLEALKLVKNVQQAEVLPANTQPIIIFLTDGQATSGETTDPKEIKDNVKKSNADLNVPVYGLAFGTGADFSLVKDISKENGHAFARRIYEGSDAAIQLEDFYLQIASPLLQDLNIEYVGELVDTDTVVKSQEAGGFNKGNEIVVAGKLREPEEGEEEFVTDDLDIMIAGNSKEGSYIKNIRICRPEPRPMPIIIDPVPVLEDEEQDDDEGESEDPA